MPKSTPDLINFGLLWRDLNLGILILSSYAQGHNRHNPIEHSWFQFPRRAQSTVVTILPFCSM